MFEKAKHNARAGLDVKDELLDALSIAKKVGLCMSIRLSLMGQLSL